MKRVKQQPISTEADKYAYLAKFEAEIRAATTLVAYNELIRRLARAMKKDGIYRKSTSTVDIESSISKRIKRLGWTK